jgi:hypothetical protein
MIFKSTDANYLLIWVPDSGSLMQNEMIMTSQEDYNLAMLLLRVLGQRLGFERKAIFKLSNNPTNPNNVTI